jgi:hypothetical protein
MTDATQECVIETALGVTTMIETQVTARDTGRIANDAADAFSSVAAGRWPLRLAHASFAITTDCAALGLISRSRTPLVSCERCSTGKPERHDARDVYLEGTCSSL